MNEIFKLVATIETNGKTAIRDIKGVETQGSKTSQKLSAAFTKIGKVAKFAFLAAAVAAAGMFVVAIKKAAEFEKSMAMVQSVTGATAAEFENLEVKAKELGKTSKFSMTEIADGMEFLGRAGFETTEIIAAMDGVVALASSQVMDLGRAADITSNILTGMGLEAGEAGRVADVLAQTAASANVNVEMLGESFKYVAPLAAAAGWSIEETAAAIGKMGDAGIQGGMAGTALRFAIAELIGESDAFKDALGELGMTMDELKGPDGQLLGMAETMGVFEEKGFGAAEMLALFGKRAGPGMAILLQEGKDGLASYTTSLDDAGGAAQRMADIQLDTLAGQLTILKGSFDLLLVTIGEDMLPIFKNVLKNAIIPFVNGITEWLEKMGGIKGVIGHALIAVGEWIRGIALWVQSHKLLNTIIDKLYDGFSRIFNWVKDHSDIIIKAIIAIGAAFAAWQVAAWVASLNPLTLVLVALAAAGTAIAAFWPEISAAWEKVRGILANNEELTAAWESLKKAAGKLWDTIKEAFASISVAFGGTGDSVVSFRDIAKAVFDVVVKSITVMVTIIAAQLTIIKDGFKIVGSLLRGDWQQAWTDFKDYLSTLWDTIVKILDIIGLTDAITAGWEALKVKTVQIWGSIKDSISDIWADIVSWFSTALQDLIDTVTGWMPGWLKTWLGVGEDAGENAAQGLKNSTSDVKTAAGDLKDTMLDGATPTDKEAQDIGHKLAAGVIVGWTDAQSMAVINAGAKKLTKAQIDALNKAAGIKSPAKEFMPVGEAETEGVIAGMLAAADRLIETGKNLIKITVPPMEEEADKAGTTVGKTYTDAVSDGIKAGTPGVMDAEADFRDGLAAAYATSHTDAIDSEKEFRNSLEAAYTTSHADAIDSEKTFREGIEAAYTAANNTEEAALAAHNADDVEEVKSFWQRVQDVVDAGTTDSAETIGTWLNNIKSVFSNRLSSIVKDVAAAFAKGEATSIPEIIGQGMLDIASSIFDSGIDQAVDWAVDKLWSMVTEAQAATSVLGTIAGVATPLLIGAGAADPLVQDVVKPWLDENVAPVMHTILDPIGDVISGIARGISSGFGWLGDMIGFASGGVFNQPTLLPAHMVAEGGYSEAYLPLSPAVYAEMGTGIIGAIQGMEVSGEGGSGDLRGSTVDRLEVNVAIENAYMRDEEEVGNVSQLLAEKLAVEVRSLGLVTV